MRARIQRGAALLAAMLVVTLVATFAAVGFGFLRPPKSGEGPGEPGGPPPGSA